MLNTQISKGLRNLKDLGSIRLEAFASIDDWIDKVRAWKRADRKAGLTISISVYGSQCLAHIVGDGLSKQVFTYSIPNTVTMESSTKTPISFGCHIDRFQRPNKLCLPQLRHQRNGSVLRPISRRFSIH